MTYSVMQDLYWGNLVPWERGRPQDPSYAPITQKASEINEHFKDILSSEEYKRFEEMEDLETGRRNMEEIQLFEYAFRMGVLMMIDVLNFSGKKNCKPQKRITQGEKGLPQDSPFSLCRFGQVP